MRSTCLVRYPLTIARYDDRRVRRTLPDARMRSYVR
jgi:hypothetical protein